MTPKNPDWESFKKEPFAPYIPDEVFQYRSDEIEKIIAWKKEHPLSMPMEVEIGSNYGRFLLGLARGRREMNFLGIELKAALVSRFVRRIEREGDTNCKCIHADARLAIPVLFEPGTLDAIYVLFPDPWWKKKHARRRLLDDAFFNMAHVFLKTGGMVVVKTDVRPYYETVCEALALDKRFETIPNDAIPNADKWDLTNREQHCIENGVPYDTLAVRKV